MLSTSILSLLATSTLAFAASNNVAIYWGQNGAGGQDRLSHYCDNSDAEIVLLSFLNDFPDPTNVNFANQCGDTYPSGLLHCQRIGEDIKTCQSQGKKVLLSLGGAAGKYGFSNTNEATEFANTLWNKFGNGSEDPERPFDDAIVDGFDFDIELGESTGYSELATSLRSKFDGSKQYYLSASPQCVYPDAKVGELLSKVPLDFAFIQFYNNYCSLDGSFNYDTWSKFADSAPNSNIQLFVGIPATDNINGYVNSDDLAKKIDEIKCDKHFAGVSLWDASGAFSNINSNGENYLQQVKSVLNDATCPAPSSTSSTTSSTSTTSTTSSSSSSSTSAVTTTSSDVTTTSTTSSAPTTSSSVLVLTSSSSGYQNTTSSSIEGGVSGSVSITSSSSASNGASSESGSSSEGSNGSNGSNGSSEGSNKSNGGALSTVTDIKHTVVTITSCSENKCSKVPVETGIVIITENETVFTTYCPLTASSVVVPVHPKSSESVAVVIPSETKPVVSIPGETESASKTKPVIVASETKPVVVASETKSTVAAESSAPSVVVIGEGSTGKPSVTIATEISKSTNAGETETYYVEVTSTISSPIIVQGSSSIASNYTNNGTIPVYEGSASQLNSAIFTIPLLLVVGAVALI